MEFGIQAVVWLILLVVMLALEAATLGLTTIWFAGGALAGFALAMAGVSFQLQLAAFCAVSGLLLFFTRPAAVRWLNRGRLKTNAQSLVGEMAVVTEQIDNLANTGQVQVHGQFWTARAEDETVIPGQTRVRIQSISGVKLIVKEETANE